MSIFKRKKLSQQIPAEQTDQVFDAQLREELRNRAKEHFQKILEEQTADLKSDVDAVLEQLTGSLRRHMASQLDLAITRINNEISNQFKEQMSEYNRVSSEAQELVVQSLSRNAQSVYEKYQQMATNLQQVVASQEVMMVGVFQDSQSRVASLQAEQDRAMEDLKRGMELTQQRSEQLSQKLTSDAEDQSKKLQQIYQQNTERASQVSVAQERSLAALSQTVNSLDDQYAKLQQMMDESISRQKDMTKELVNQHLAKIVEHYLVAALGENSDLVRDLPMILERLEENKQAMMDDISL